MREPIDTAEVLADLRGFVDELESGYRSVQAGVGLLRVAGVPVVPRAVHNALCGWRIFTPQEEAHEADPSKPLVVACAGCGLGMVYSEWQGRGV